MLDKAKLGVRYVCFSCGTKFYDLNRAEPTCPECGADQRQAPTRDLKALLAGKGPIRRPRQEEEEEAPSTDEDEDLGLIDDDADDEDAEIADDDDDDGSADDDDDW